MFRTSPAAGRSSAWPSRRRSPLSMAACGSESGRRHRLGHHAGAPAPPADDRAGREGAGRHQVRRQADHRHRLDVRAERVPRHRRQDRDRLRRRPVQRGRREARPDDRVAVGDVRQHHPRREQREVRHRRLLVHDQRGPARRRPRWSPTSRPAPSGRPRPARRSTRTTPAARRSRCRPARCRSTTSPRGRRSAPAPARRRSPIDQYQKQTDATTAVVTGKDDAMLADSPVCAYAVKQTNGQLALVGDIYDSAPYGYVRRQGPDRLRGRDRRARAGADRRRHVQDDPRQVGRHGRRDHRRPRSTRTVS